jgi:Holliday junction resolvase RusA-like endonuclease
MTKHENNNPSSLPAPNVEQNTSHEPMGKKKTAPLDSPVNIRVISTRSRPHDTDGVSVKAVLDGIVRAGILPDDSSKQIKSITFESKQGKKENTIISIETLDTVD